MMLLTGKLLVFCFAVVNGVSDSGKGEYFHYETLHVDTQALFWQSPYEVEYRYGIISFYVSSANESLILSRCKFQ